MFIFTCYYYRFVRLARGMLKNFAELGKNGGFAYGEAAMAELRRDVEGLIAEGRGR